MRIYCDDEIRAHVLAGVVFAIRGAQHQGGNAQFVAGVLAMAEHGALTVRVDWEDVLADARKALSADAGRLIDVALQLGAGTPGER